MSTFLESIESAFTNQINSISGRQKKNKVFDVTKKFETLLPRLTEETSLSEFVEYGICIDAMPSKEDLDSSKQLVQSLIEKTCEPYLKTQFMCICGSIISNSAKTKHFQSSKHLSHVTTMQLEATIEEYKTKYHLLKMRVDQDIDASMDDEKQVRDCEVDQDEDVDADAVVDTNTIQESVESIHQQHLLETSF
jgi:hypothetical protein